MSEWQQMESAPKGVDVLVAYPRYKPENKTMTPDEYTIFIAHHDELSWDTGFWRLHEEPHFWMPLPAPPSPVRTTAGTP